MTVWLPTLLALLGALTWVGIHIHHANKDVTTGIHTRAYRRRLRRHHRPQHRAQGAHRR